ncbi:MAG: RNA-binding S4 domain-containing protein [Oscillospiraceae bacterium]|nr:RNA-binding S4 domain-containing protein [Oscillospiraceae bacterium]
MPIAVQAPGIRLDAFLKLANAVESGGQAKLAVQGGRVWLNGALCTLRGKKLAFGDEVRCNGTTYKIEACGKRAAEEQGLSAQG